MQVLPYGSWPSPIDAALTATHDGRPEYVGFVGDEVWWTAPRPAERGRRTLVRRRPDGTEESVLPAPWNVRSRVVEYGGQPWAGAVRDGRLLVVFVHFADQRLYGYEPGSAHGAEPRPLTPVSSVGGGLRWAEPQLLLERGEVWCVLEEFTGGGPTDVRRVLAAVPLDGSAADDRGAVRELTDDRRRFVTGARLSPDGRRAAWLAWDHPLMPWEGTEVVVADVMGDGTLGGARVVAGGPQESIAQVDWIPSTGYGRPSSDHGRRSAPDGARPADDGQRSADAGPQSGEDRLLYTSDRSGWWNLYRDHRPLCPREEEFGGALWKLGQRWFAPLESGLVAVVHGRGATVLGILDPETGELVDAAGPWTEFAPTLAVQGDRVVAVAAGPRSGYEVVELDARTGRARVVGAAHDDAVDPAYYPEPRIRTFTGPEGRDIHAHVYPPHHPGHVAPGHELPPYVVWAHGGPTDRAPLVLDLEIAYFTSRGIGVAEVDYGGSTGYGREYRERLREQWGVVDVEDCAAVALALADEGTADRRRLAVRGGSAGGWTAAVSLAGTDVYACGTIRYPVLDLVGWATGETHDFESRYPESLVGPLAQVPARYAQRSPIEHAHRITVPFLLLQGLDDMICPPAQCERFLARLAGRTVPHAYLAFEGEGHGFRQAATMVRALEAELSLYAQVFGLRPPGIPRLELVR
ncbi:S9 family peptidase [Streptomyces rishiriensis]|uniref:Dipeptidyl aminopeptidase/acylaminoacyl peptidase n=1 Tax=Streptomyces rishiriensis TaxID=68264 RepID=A0ABU0P093_STRRH|nr:prolyl oligopeptidase family serine peptidase [Streptomyces rishiriensis]MDQ0584378.1 dipeptidyl aminopeptidase/acylaminoacyl peptidase [Streptomyces rishiriensis]